MLNFDPYLNVLPNIAIAFVIGLLITPFLRRYALKHGFSTKPKSEWKDDERNASTVLHSVTMPRLGEFAMLIPLGLLMWRDVNLDTQILGIVFSIAMIAVIGAFDSKYNLSEFIKLYALFFASILLIFTGTVIDIHSIIGLNSFDYYINNPITQGQLSLLSALFTLAWMYIIPTALSYVGGSDGLSEGTCAIAIMILTLIGIRTGDVLTITIGSLCLGGLLGLLPYNFHPAVIFSEHLIYGFVIAILAIISKGKITTSLLILTVPLIDFIYVSSLRLKKYFKENKGIHFRLLLHYMGSGDKTHFHHKLMDLGHTPVRIALIQYTMYGILGVIALAVSGMYLTLAIISSVVIIVLIFYYINRRIHNDRQ
jgi:UDP-GlcNAc:undecaprenyl-phosphate/decaprenyl-phosphate GlcNAc-1-phosphate transferase